MCKVYVPLSKKFWPLKRASSKNAATAARSLQSCRTLCDPINGSPPGSPISGILQARTLEWVAISFSNAWKWKVKGKSLSCVQLLETPWTTAYQALPSMGFSRQEFWSGVPLPSPFLKTFIQIQEISVSHNIINYFEIHLNLKLFCFEVIVERFNYKFSIFNKSELFRFSIHPYVISNGTIQRNFLLQLIV